MNMLSSGFCWMVVLVPLLKGEGVLGLMRCCCCWAMTVCSTGMQDGARDWIHRDRAMGGDDGRLSDARDERKAARVDQIRVSCAARGDIAVCRTVFNGCLQVTRHKLAAICEDK